MSVNETENCEDKKVWKILKNRPYINRKQSLLCIALHKLLLNGVLMIVAEQEVFKGNFLLVREELL